MHPLAIRILEIKIPNFMEKMPKLGKYDGKGGPDEHVHIVNDRLKYFSIDDTSK